MWLIPTTSSSAVYDVVVIGAGPAGSVTAHELARAGKRVLLVDRARFPRPKVCGCCLNGLAIATLQRLGLARCLSAAVPLSCIRLAASGRWADVPLPSGVALSREAFDARLVEAARSAGAEFQQETTARLGEEQPDGWELLLNGAPIRARVVVQATGLSGGEAEPEPGSRIGVGAMLISEKVPHWFEEGTIYMATARQGYVGLVRVEDGRLDVAAAIDPGFVKAAGGPGPAVTSIVRSAGWRFPENIEPVSWKGVPALTRQPQRVAGRRWFAVGDAAGYIEPFTGEGMAWAVRGAEALAPIVAWAAGRWDNALAKEWTRIHRERVGRRHLRCRLVARALRRPALCRLTVGTLSYLPVLARPMVAAINR